jgi:hypothetical protein
MQGLERNLVYLDVLPIFSIKFVFFNDLSDIARYQKLVLFEEKRKY